MERTNRYSEDESEKNLIWNTLTHRSKQRKSSCNGKGRDYHVSLELDLRGERFENAMARVEKYLDDAQLASYPRVSIIHGKGQEHFAKVYKIT